MLIRKKLDFCTWTRTNGDNGIWYDYKTGRIWDGLKPWLANDANVFIETWGICYNPDGFITLST